MSLSWLAVVLCPSLVLAGEWNRFRGPNGSGVTDATGLPVRFGPNENLRWRMPLPEGNSSPIVVGDRVFVTGFDADKLITLAIDRQSGKLAWRAELPRLQPGRYHAL